MNRKWLFASAAAVALAVLTVTVVFGVSGAAFTTFNPWVDGMFKDVCKNSLINCNIYGAKTDVWLNGGPAANGLGPDGSYFFAVLVPGGQPDPNDGSPKNLSDDFDTWTNRTFTIKDGEVIAYSGTHDLDSGNTLNPNRPYCNNKRGCAPDGKVPFIRLAPYADTTNPGGVYIMAICSLNGGGYPVTPRDCKYDAFKVKEGPVTIDFMVSGIKFEDIYADGVKDVDDPGLPGWEIHITGTGFLGEAIDETKTTGVGGYWEFGQSYLVLKTTPVYPAQLHICETVKADWYQSYPASTCYDVTIQPAAMAYVGDLDFGNYQKVTVKACKFQDLDGVPGGDIVQVPGWLVSRTEGGTIVDTQPTGADGCYTWTDLMPGIVYDLHEQNKPGWFALTTAYVVFQKARSGESYAFDFVNAAYQGCTPGFWQGGSAGGQAGGQWLWNENMDPDWVASGGKGYNPYVWDTPFSPFFTLYGPLGAPTMYSRVDGGGGPNDYEKAARSLVAAYLNASWGMVYPYSTADLKAMWTKAVNGQMTFLELHNLLDAANNAYHRPEGGEHCPISASIQ